GRGFDAQPRGGPRPVRQLDGHPGSDESRHGDLLHQRENHAEQVKVIPIAPGLPGVNYAPGKPGLYEGNEAMKSLSNVRNVVSLAGTALVFTAVLGVVALQSSPDTSSGKSAPVNDETKRSWPMYGGSLSRNLVNLAEKGIPTTWDAAKN